MTDTEQEFYEQCQLATAALTEIAVYINEKDNELEPHEVIQMTPVILAFKMFAEEANSDDDSEFRVDDTLT
jgi:hypothetical protein